MKKSRFLSLVLTLSVLAALFLPVSASALEEPALNCTHAVLLDANYNEVLYEKGAYEKAYPASITKVMTALLVLEAIQEGKFAPDTPITASAWARSTLPFKKARRVNSPGPAGEAPASSTSCKSRLVTYRPPWQESSTTSSPV